MFGIIGMENFNSLECKIFGRIRQNNQVFYSEIYDQNHKRQSSICKWLNEGQECYGLVHKFVQYKENNMFIASKFKRKLEIFEIIDFSDTYKSILQGNDFSKYFPVFEKFKYEETNVILCMSKNLSATCVLTNIEKTNYAIVTPVIGFEHD